jgi:hypothetical protein
MTYVGKKFFQTGNTTVKHLVLEFNLAKRNCGSKFLTADAKSFL